LSSYIAEYHVFTTAHWQPYLFKLHRSYPGKSVVVVTRHAQYLKC